MPPTRPHVVVGVSDKQPQALEFGLAEAARTNAELVVVHAAGMPVGAYDAYSGVTAIGALRQAGELVLQASRDLVTGLMPTVPVHYVLSSMTPASALEHEARGARLIVVGADDVDWFDRMLGGAVADHLVRRSSVPVAVIPEQDPPPSGHGVVVAIDGSTAARRRRARRGRCRPSCGVASPPPAASSPRSCSSAGPSRSRSWAGPPPRRRLRIGGNERLAEWLR